MSPPSPASEPGRRWQSTVLVTLAISGLGACNLYVADHTSKEPGRAASWGTPDGSEPRTCRDGGLPAPDAGAGYDDGGLPVEAPAGLDAHGC